MTSFVEEPVLPGNVGGELVACEQENSSCCARVKWTSSALACSVSRPIPLVGEGVPQAVAVHVIVHADVAVLEALAALSNRCGALDIDSWPPAHDDLELTRTDQLSARGDRVDTRQTDLVDAQRRQRSIGMPCLHSSLPGRKSGPAAGRQHWP